MRERAHETAVEESCDRWAEVFDAQEKLYQLEQLRALENGLTIAVAVATVAPGPGVDTEADLARVEALLGMGRD